MASSFARRRWFERPTGHQGFVEKTLGRKMIGGPEIALEYWIDWNRLVEGHPRHKVEAIGASFLEKVGTTVGIEPKTQPIREPEPPGEAQDFDLDGFHRSAELRDMAGHYGYVL